MQQVVTFREGGGGGRVPLVLLDGSGQVWTSLDPFELVFGQVWFGSSRGSLRLC